MQFRKSVSSLLFSLLVLCITTAASGQSNASSTGKKLEIGAQLTSLTLFRPESQGYPGYDVTEPGFGGRLTYNLTDKIAVEAELNLFPNKNVFQFLGEGRAVQGQFGVKAGKRFQRFGLFAKARPGFLSVGDVFFFEPGATGTSMGVTLINERIARRTYFTTDVGGVLEFYPSRQAIVRFDAGDTIVRYSPGFEPIGFNPATLTPVAAKIKHNFQFTVGVGFGFLDSNPGSNISPTKLNHQEKVPRYEVGVQFTSITFKPTGPICFDICLAGTPLLDTEPGFGGRFTYNINQHIALEAEGNFLPRLSRIGGGGGHQFQTLFGGKIGKRWARFGIFGKARPGMLSFSNVSNLVRTQTGLFGTIPFTFGIFRQGWKSYFSFDAGGVMEYYVSRRIMARIDMGDTIVHYNEFPHPGASVSHALLRRPPETHHNFQFTAGVGLRF
jgi:hypothetical protein